jgi:uncharacterized protein (DUF433 family)
MAFERITVDPDQMGGMPCIRGLRIPVSTVVGMVADGMDFQEILHSYPDLEKEDIAEALRFANFPNIQEPLEQGSIVVIGKDRVRVRSLPIS